MGSHSFMLIAGESSGDVRAAELVTALKNDPIARAQPFPPTLFGAGGPRMAAVGVELHVDMTRHAVVGLIEVFRNIRQFRQLFRDLIRLAFERQPDVIILIDFGGFNRRYARALRRLLKRKQGPFFKWSPRIVYYIPPQVWGSRPGRAKTLAEDCDLLITIFPFERPWYRERFPDLPVHFVGHPIVDRYAGLAPAQDGPAGFTSTAPGDKPLVLLLPGSRRGELQRHLPPIYGACRLLEARHPVRFRMVVPNDTLAKQCRALNATPPADLIIATSDLPEHLSQADLAIASTGTVTVECAYFNLPAVTLYITSWSTYQIGKRIVSVPYLAMPNLLANQPVYPEFIQHAATAENIATAAEALLTHTQRRTEVKQRLHEIIQTLGPPGATQRAARLIWEQLKG